MNFQQKFSVHKNEISRILLLISLVISSLLLSAQSTDVYKEYNIYRNPARVFLNKFSVTLTSGIGRTNYKHDLDGFYFVQTRNNQYILPIESATDLPQFEGYENWFNNPVLGEEVIARDPFDVPFPDLTNPVLNPELRHGFFFARGDTTEIGFSGYSPGIPITLQVHLKIKEKFRIGVGYGWEKQWVRELQPTNYVGLIRPYQPNFKSTRYSRLFLTGGYKFYEYYEHLYVFEFQLGRIRSGPKEFNRSVVAHGAYMNLGVSMEKQLSEYFRVILKPSIDIKNYNVNVGGRKIRHGYPTLFFQFGVSINIPEIPRSPIKNDHIQLKHVITDPKSGRLIEVRGQPITKWQNPKVGQNHRKLWRYKWRNRKKLDPY